MYSLIISILLALVLGIPIGMWSIGWGIFAGLVAYVTAMVLINRHFAKQLAAIVEKVQIILTETQAQANKVAGTSKNMKVLEKKLETVAEQGIADALVALEAAEPIYKWNLLAQKQVNTLKFQLHFQVKHWDECDALMPKIMLMEPGIIAMKLARMQMRGDELDIMEKVYTKGTGKFKYEKATIIISTWAWILLKRKEEGKALEVLAETKGKAESEVISRNWELVANGKAHQFSNAALGDMWYGLHLELPKQPKPSKGQMMKQQHPMHGKGKRRHF